MDSQTFSPTSSVPPQAEVPPPVSTAKARGKKLFIIFTITFLAVVSFLISFMYFYHQRKVDLRSRAAEENTNQSTDLVVLLSPTFALAPTPIICRAGEKLGFGRLGTEVSEASTAADQVIATIPIIVRNDSFSPRKILVKQNQILTLSFISMDKTYDVSFPELSLSTVVPANERKSLHFQAVATGEFIFNCSQNCADWTLSCGTLTVEPS